MKSKNMKKINLMILMLGLITSACSNSFKEKMGLYGKDSPDEFSVISNPPLSIPPNFDLDITHQNNNAKNSYFPYSDSNASNRSYSKGEELLLNKATSEADNDYRSVLEAKGKSSKKKSFFQKLFNKKTDFSKDATEHPAANEEDRIYKSKSLKLMKTNNTSSNRKICNIDNGEVIYCDKNTFMKSFSFSPSPPKSQ
ncbi:MAG: DUF3035 domain-containing protein [Alphaproteobacteria bacterium]